MTAMQNGLQKRTRSQRVAALELPPGMVDRFVDSLQRAEVLWRIALCIAAALVMWCILGGWAPPFPYRLGYTPTRDIDAKVSFKQTRLRKQPTRRSKRPPVRSSMSTRKMLRRWCNCGRR